MAASVENFLSCSICFGRFDRPKSLPCQHTFCERCLESQVRPRQPFKCPNCQRPVQLPPEGVVGLPDNDLVENLYRQIDSSSSLSVTAVRASKGEKTCYFHPLEDLKLFCQQCHIPVCTECLDESHAGHSAITIRRASEQRKASIRALVAEGRRAVETYYTFLSELRNVEKILEKNKRTAAEDVTAVYDDVVRKATLRKENLLSEIEDNNRRNLDAIEGQRNIVLNQVDEISTACDKVEQTSIYDEEETFEDEKHLQSLIAKKDKVVMKPLLLDTAEFDRAEDEKDMLNLGELRLQAIPSGQRVKRKSSSSASVNSDKRSQQQQARPAIPASTKNDTEKDAVRRKHSTIKVNGDVQNAVEKAHEKTHQATVEQDSGKTAKHYRGPESPTEMKKTPVHCALCKVPREDAGVVKTAAAESVHAGAEHNGKTEEPSGDNKGLKEEDEKEEEMPTEELKRKPSIPRRIRIQNGFLPPEHPKAKAQATEVSQEQNDIKKEDINHVDKNPSSVSATSLGSGDEASKDGLVRKILGGYQESGTLGGRGSGFGKFVDPGGVAASDKEIFVADYGKNQILVFDLQGKYLRCFSTTLPGLDSDVMKPHDVALDRDGHLWVAGHEEDDIAVQYSVEGNFRHKIRLPHATIARGIAVNLSKNLVLVTETNGTSGVVRVLRSDGSLLRTVGGQQEMKVPRYLAVDKDGNIFVSDSAARGIFVFDEDGNFKFKFGDVGSGEGQLKGHRGVATDNSGNVIVADCENHRVERFSRDGEFVGHLATGVQEPWAVAVGPAGHIILTDRHSHTVTIVQAAKGRKESYI